MSHCNVLQICCISCKTVRRLALLCFYVQNLQKASTVLSFSSFKKLVVFYKDLCKLLLKCETYECVLLSEYSSALKKYCLLRAAVLQKVMMTRVDVSAGNVVSNVTECMSARSPLFISNIRKTRQTEMVTA